MAEKATESEKEVVHLFLASSGKIHHDSKNFDGGRCIAKHKIKKKGEIKPNQDSDSTQISLGGKSVGDTNNNETVSKIKKKEEIKPNHPGYVENCSCSYRWQGKHSDNNNPHIYNRDRPELVAIIRNGTARDDVAQAPEGVKQKIGALKKALDSEHVSEQGIEVSRKTSKGRWYPQYYGQNLNLPRENTKGDWYLNGPLKAGYKNLDKLTIYKFTKKVAGKKSEQEREINNKEAKSGRTNQDSIPVGANFTKEFWPYWNNHHHLIPAGILEKLMRSVAKIFIIKEQVFFDWIAMSPYNLHSRKNVQILPRDRSVSLLLSLPRHLRHEEPLIDKDGKLIKGEYYDHPQYSEEVELRLKPILIKAASSFRGKKRHKRFFKEKADIGKNLDRISRELSEQLLQLGGMTNLPISADHLKLPSDPKYLKKIKRS